MNPAIVLVAPEHAADLTDEFGRYARDYDVLTTTSVEEAEAGRPPGRRPTAARS